MQKPSVGRVVHYLAVEGEAPHPALVTRVWSDTCVNLQAFPVAAFPSELTSVVLGSGARSWSWPPHVPQPAK